MPKDLPVRDLTNWMSDIMFQIPVEYKMSKLWMAQWIFFMKRDGNTKPFLDPKRWAKYTDLEHMVIDKKEYIDLIDPPTKMGGGGTAEYFASDFKDFPIDQHLNNQLRAKLDKIGIENQLQVNEIDKYAKGQRQREKDRILYQQEVRSLINELNETIGIPKIKESQSPYNYMKSLKNDKKSDKDGNSDVNENLIDYIRSQINDSQDMTLFMSYVYKGDIEKAIELGIQHYLININKWSIECQKFNNDLVKFNKACGLWYTDETSGRGTVEYLHPCSLHTSPFKCFNGEDVQWWFYEKDITFSDFVRKFGMNLTDNQLKEVFEINKTDGAGHGMEWGSHKGAKGSQAKIRIGQMSVLSQDAEKFAEKYAVNRQPIWQQKPLSWIPDKRTPNKYKAEVKNKMYNVWYSCYYVPPPGSKLGTNSQTDWNWQSQYIFNVHKDVDMYRYGVDARYAKSILVIWKDERPSVYDIKEAFMPKMRTAWHNFQNCLINDIDAVGLSEEFINAALAASDEANNNGPGNPTKPTGGNGISASLTITRQIKQGGMAILKMVDRDGRPMVDPQKFVVRIQNGMLEKGEKYLNAILQLYQLMTTALAQSDVSEGQDPKPRTAVAGIQASLQATAQGTWFVEKGAREFLVMFGERFVQWLFWVIQEHKVYKVNERWEELQSVIGVGNALALESIEDYDPEKIGMTVTLEDVSAMKKFYVDLTQVMLKDGKIADEDVEMITSTILQNYKYGATLLNISSKKIKREMARQKELEQQYIMEQKQADLQAIQAQNAGKSAGKDQNIMTEGKVKAMIDQRNNEMKHQSMMEQKEKMKNNRLEENAQKAEFQRQQERDKPLVENTQSSE